MGGKYLDMLILIERIDVTRAMLHNLEDYPEPETFNPDRFMLDGALNPAVPDPIAAFGFGRR